MVPPKPELRREALIAAAQEVAKKFESDRLSITRFGRATGINPSRIYEHFDTWESLCREAGLQTGARKLPAIPVDTLIKNLHDAITEIGGVRSQKVLLRRLPHSEQAYRRTFGSWGGALIALKRWLPDNDPNFAYAKELDARLLHAERTRVGFQPDRIGDPHRPPWRSIGARASGPPLAFRAMAAAPVNEMGVVLLFGMVAGELGYAVEAIGTAFPDCAAKRLVADGPTRSGKADEVGRGADARWEPVRIEFEYRSRSFLYHAHDADDCDVIVCWQHDWPDCPLEVLELSAVVAALQGEGRG